MAAPAQPVQQSPSQSSSQSSGPAAAAPGRESAPSGSRDRLKRAVATSGGGFDAQAQMLAPPAAAAPVAAAPGAAAQAPVAPGQAQAPAQGAPVPAPPGGVQGPAPGAGPVDPEVAAQAEDRAAFQNVDGAVDKFTDVPKIGAYFNTECPQKWRAANRNHASVLDRCRTVGITEAQVNALVGYTGPGYAPMNRLTRGQMKSTYFKTAFQPYVTASSVALTKLNDGKKKNSQRGWRTIPGGDRDASVIENLYGREYVDEAGYMSTTLNSDQSMFAGPVSLQITASEGVNIKDFSLFPSEGEVLFKPGTRFKVKRFHKNADVEAAWKAWHRDNTQPKPAKPWFEVDLEGP
jgi:hypothetical protein